MDSDERYSDVNTDWAAVERSRQGAEYGDPDQEREAWERTMAPFAGHQPVPWLEPGEEPDGDEPQEEPQVELEEWEQELEDVIAEQDHAEFAEEALEEQHAEAWEELHARWPQMDGASGLYDPALTAQVAARVEEVADELEYLHADLGLAAELVDDPVFVASVLRKDFADHVQPQLRGEELFLELHAEQQAKRIEWNT